MKANIVDDIKGAPPGSIEPRHIDGVLQGFGITCPGCGEESWIPVNRGSHCWTCPSEDPVTLHPSIHHVKDKGGCGWHGWLRNGEFTPCQ